MKLAGSGAAVFCARPDPAVRGVLLHGRDAGLVALRRRQLVGLLTDADDLRLTRLDASVAQKDPAEIDAALRARGFFPGRRVVLIEGARDTLAKPLKEILAGLGSGRLDEDAVLVVTAQNLMARSSLRRLFEGSGDLAALGLYPEPLREAELAEMLHTAAPQAQLTPVALQELTAVAVQSDRGALLQLVEKIAIYAIGREDPIGANEMAQLLPAAADSDLDRLVAAVAEGRPEAVGPLIGRLGAAGIGAAGMLIATGRHFRHLLGLAAARDGIDAALGRLRPPAFGPRRRALASQARRWGPRRLESANRLLFQADRTLRSPGKRPDRALVERCLIRLAMMAGRG